MRIVTILCGGRLSEEKEVVTTCPRHTCSPVASFKELPEHGLELMPFPKHAEGMKALCLACSSQRIVARTDYLECKDCGAQFQPSEIGGFGLSDDARPQICQHCNTVYYWMCSCYQQAGSSS